MATHPSDPTLSTLDVPPLQLLDVVPYGGTLPKNLPLHPVTNDHVPSSFLTRGPLPGLAAETQMEELVSWLSEETGWCTLDPGIRVPAGKGRITLTPFISPDGRDRHLLACLLDVPEPLVVRVLLYRLRSRALIGGTLVEEGVFLRLPAGRHPFVMIFDTVKDYTWDQLHAIPRLVPCTEAMLADRQDLREKRLAEARALAAQRPVKAADEILPETIIGTEGFIRVGKSREGFWWYLDAEGQPFYMRGVTSVNRPGTQGGRRAVDGPYAATVDRKYDYASGPQRFVSATLERLHSWGFNGLSSWTAPEFFEQPGWYYHDNLEFIRGFPTMVDSHLVDVFDPQWRAFIDRKARAICAPQRNNKWLAGYFTDNEIGFPTVGTVRYDEIGNPILGGMKPSLLETCLRQPASAPAHQEALRFLAQRHGSSEQAYDGPMEENLSASFLLSDAFRADADAFAWHFAETFFRQAALAIRRYDPNHLVLGCRWAGPQRREIMAAESRWVDVLSVNNYQDMFWERLEEHPNPLNLPVVIGEFCWNDDGHQTIRAPFEAPEGLTMAERMVETGRKAIMRLFGHPNVIGFNWYRFVAEDRYRSPRNCGLVNFDDDANPANVPGLLQVWPHPEALRLRAEKQAAGPVQPFAQDLVVVLQNAAFFRDPVEEQFKVVFGLHFAEGDLPSVYAYGSEGRVLEAGFVHGTFRVVVELTFNGEVFVRARGRARYQIVLDCRRGTHLTGQYSGELEGVARQGRVSAWIDGEPEFADA